MLLRLSVVRLFYDHLVVEGFRPTNPVLAAYLDRRRQITRERGRLFVSFSNRNLGRPISVWAWAKAMAHRIFGRARVERALDRIVQAIVDWGYAAPSRKSLHFTLCEVFLFVRSPVLEDITLDQLTRLRAVTARHTRLRGGILCLSRALAGLGLIPKSLNAYAYDASARLTPRTIVADRPNELTAIVPA